MPFFGGGGAYKIVGTNIKGGNSALAIVTGDYNMGLGNGTLQNLDNGFRNIAIGTDALHASVASIDSIAIGFDALLNDGGGSEFGNIAIGTSALQTFSFSLYAGNIAIGQNALANFTAGDYNTVVGLNSDMSSGSKNVGIGSYIFPGGYGDANVALGYSACRLGFTSGNDYNVVIGYKAGYLPDGASGNIIIGANANIPATNGNNGNIVIGNGSETYAEIAGVQFLGADGPQVPSQIVGDPGTEGTGINVGGVVYNAVLNVSDLGSTNIANQILHRHSTIWPSILVGARSNSDTSAHGVVTNSMQLFSLYGVGWTGTEYNIFGTIRFEVSASGTISDSSSPGDIVFSTTPNGATAEVERVRISSSGAIGLSGENYGTAGQVLTSQGNGSPPVWANAGGSASQLVYNAITGAFSTANPFGFGYTAPDNTQGAEITTLTITPSAAGNRIVVNAALLLAIPSAGQGLIALYVNANASADAIATVSLNTIGMVSLTFEYTATSTSPITFHLRYGSNVAGTTYVNSNAGGTFFGGKSGSFISAQEYGP